MVSAKTIKTNKQIDSILAKTISDFKVPIV